MQNGRTIINIDGHLYNVPTARLYNMEPPDDCEWVYNVGSADTENLPTAFPFIKAKPQPDNPECKYTSEQLIEMGLVGIYRKIEDPRIG